MPFVFQHGRPSDLIGLAGQAGQAQGEFRNAMLAREDQQRQADMERRQAERVQDQNFEREMVGLRQQVREEYLRQRTIHEASLEQIKQRNRQARDLSGKREAARAAQHYILSLEPEDMYLDMRLPADRDAIARLAAFKKRVQQSPMAATSLMPAIEHFVTSQLNRAKMERAAMKAQAEAEMSQRERVREQLAQRAEAEQAQKEERYNRRVEAAKTELDVAQKRYEIAIREGLDVFGASQNLRAALDEYKAAVRGERQGTRQTPGGQQSQQDAAQSIGEAWLNMGTDTQG